MQQKDSHAYKKRILLAVAARSPQIITEAVYALAQQTTPAYHTTEIHIITTQRGKPFVETLLDANGKTGHLTQLCDDYQLAKPVFNASQIHLIPNDSGGSLDDVRTCDDNTHAADFITHKVQQLTQDDDSSLVVLLSGGRRTMTFYAGYALSLLGRPQDKLMHVLVEDEYFFNAEFYYPPPQTRWISRDNQPDFDASKVEVTLADIPFVRLREGLPKSLLQGNVSFHEAIERTQAGLKPQKVMFNWKTGVLSCADKVVPFKPAEMTFYVWMLRRRLKSLEPIRYSDDETGNAVEFQRLYAKINGKTGVYSRVCKTLEKGMDKCYFDERKSRVNRALKKVLGEVQAEPYLLQPSGKRPLTRFGVGLHVDSIVFE